MRQSEYNALVEALRRRTRFISDPSGGQVITSHWTGLGSATAYKQAQQSGYMEIATTPNPRFATWWRLTPKGALIVAYWLGAGFTYKEIEAGKLPPRTIPVEVTK